MQFASKPRKVVEKKLQQQQYDRKQGHFIQTNGQTKRNVVKDHQNGGYTYRMVNSVLQWKFIWITLEVFPQLNNAAYKA